MKIIVLLVVAICLLLALGVVAYIVKKNIHVWLWHYLYRNLRLHLSKPSKGPIDIMFVFVDHFELNNKEDRLVAWRDHYPRLAKSHRDADGHHPKHSFFYAMDLMYEHELADLQFLVEEGVGEFELHWHHAHDTDASFVEKIQDAMTIFHRYDMMLPYQKNQASCFAFIHGNWSLANARGAEFCGVDNEVSLLKQLGCYGDFTFPALFSPAQPPMANNIYYCNSMDKQKCHFQGRDAVVGQSVDEGSDKFMVFQGPLSINLRDWRHGWHPTFEDGDINGSRTHNDPKRIDAWVRQGIHVEGRPEWQFVKIFCHGAQDHAAVVSTETDEMFSYLERRYNDGEKYRLHYVSAREAYNIVKAAEDGQQGNPNDYRDYRIPHPLKRQLKGENIAAEKKA